MQLYAFKKVPDSFQKNAPGRFKAQNVEKNALHAFLYHFH
ncbi:unnamed protein product [Staurois parvus]|uniref:Uncharacterized protein n=1 Tax=Staurois parvus TaxID=386267 RepID=A0ABN9EV26_9NEOB|nr:unnamed protein product [Staurois parvus]